jgi:hypothetical protein
MLKHKMLVLAIGSLTIAACDDPHPEYLSQTPTARASQNTSRSIDTVRQELSEAQEKLNTHKAVASGLRVFGVDEATSNDQLAVDRLTAELAKLQAQQPTPEPTPAPPATVDVPQSAPTPETAAAMQAKIASEWNKPEFKALLKPQAAKQKAEEAKEANKPIHFVGYTLAKGSVFALSEYDMIQVESAYGHGDTDYLQDLSNQGRIIVAIRPIEVARIIRQHDHRSHGDRVQFVEPNGQVYWTLRESITTTSGGVPELPSDY